MHPPLKPLQAVKGCEHTLHVKLLSHPLRRRLPFLHSFASLAAWMPGFCSQHNALCLQPDVVQRSWGKARTNRMSLSLSVSTMAELWALSSSSFRKVSSSCRTSCFPGPCCGSGPFSWRPVAPSSRSRAFCSCPCFFSRSASLCSSPALCSLMSAGCPLASCASWASGSSAAASSSMLSSAAFTAVSSRVTAARRSSRRSSLDFPAQPYENQPTLLQRFYGHSCNFGGV